MFGVSFGVYPDDSTGMASIVLYRIAQERGSATLLSSEALGRPTRNKLRTTLQAIKQAAWEYADGDASLRSRVEELLDQDKQRAERMRVAGARAEA